MSEIIDKNLERNITNEMESSFLDYSMSVIVSRALPDVRDGLKPVHRRILYGMNSLGMFANSQFKKSARIVGDVMGKYHPHGDSSIYDAMVRMAQRFSYRYMLVDGHGNFGSIDGDGAAAQRYTEARMSKISMEMIRDINKDTVNFLDNYDGNEKEPEVLPSRFPNILVNGNTGIAVGMATNIPPHNLGETIDGAIALLKNQDIQDDELMEYIKGPDFPTGGIILGNSGIKKAYSTGRGIIYLRGKAEIEVLKNGKQQIIITEIPYQVSKSTLVTKIADLVKEKVVEGITDLRDESNLNGIKIIVELKKEANANVVLNNLYKYTNLQVSYGINLLALVNGEPKVLTLKEILNNYLDYQKEIIIRRTKFDLEKFERRKHILDGLKIALANIDEVIKILKKAKDDLEAKNTLIDKYNLSQTQAEAILEMKLRRLTGLERSKIDEEIKELLLLIEELREILENHSKVCEVIEKELEEIKSKYNDFRRTNIDLTAIEYIEDESLIPNENIMVLITNKGYIKRMDIDEYRTQNKGGVGIKAITTNEEDFVEQIITTETHDQLLFFSNRGKVYKAKGYKIPEYGRQAKGLPIVNLLPLEKEEIITATLAFKEDEDQKSLLFVTKEGMVKRTRVSEYVNIRETGKIAITLKENDELIKVKTTTGKNHVVLVSNNNKMIRFHESEIREMGRNAIGVIGIKLEGGHCVDASVTTEDEEILIVTEKGYGKRTKVSEYRLTKRGGKGVKAFNSTDKTGDIIAFRSVGEEEDLIIITDFGTIIRIPVVQIAKMSRVTQGVRLIRLKESQKVSTIVNVPRET